MGGKCLHRSSNGEEIFMLFSQCEGNVYIVHPMVEKYLCCSATGLKAAKTYKVNA